MQNSYIIAATKSDHQELITVWEASVRATHHFLKEADIQAYKKLIFNEFFDELRLYCIKENDKITAFMGLDNDLLQMLFVHPLYRAKGLGKRLVEHAISQHAVNKVDVNEQNTQALGFYSHMGFQIYERFEHDSAYKPYPILAMQLKP